jgi:hypothetical protein
LQFKITTKKADTIKQLLQIYFQTQKITQVPVVVRTQSMATPIVMASYPVQSTSCIPTMYVPLIQGNHQTVQYGAATYQTANQPLVKVQVLFTAIPTSSNVARQCNTVPRNRS